MKGIWRRLRGAIGNAVVWGGAWFTGALALFGGAALFGAGVGPDPWWVALLVSMNIGVTGFLTGLAFSAYLRLGLFDRSLLSIRAGRTAVAGALVAASASVLLSALLRVVYGLPFTPPSLLSGLPLAVTFGAATAGATVYLAQRAALAAEANEAAELAREQEEVGLLLEGEIA